MIAHSARGLYNQTKYEIRITQLCSNPLADGEPTVLPQMYWTDRRVEWYSMIGPSQDRGHTERPHPQEARFNVCIKCDCSE